MLLGSIRSNSYRDPGYDDIEARVAAQLGIPAEALRAVRVGGERTNADRVSPAGARTVYQVIPATRRGLQRQYGVDAWSNPDNAALAAGHLLQDNYQAAGNWQDAVRMYHGGPNRRNWGPINRAYAARTAPMLASIGSAAPAQTIPADQEITDSYDPRYAMSDKEAAAMDQTPEPIKVTEPGTALAPVAAASAQARPHRGGLLGLLGRIAMPDPDSLWAGALRGGLFNARESQAQYRQGQADQAAAREATQATQRQTIIGQKRDEAYGSYTPVGNNVAHRTPAGGMEMIQPPTENMQMIQLWEHTPPGPLRDLIERAIRGAQYSPEVIAAQGAQRVEAARVGAGARVNAARIGASGRSAATTQRGYQPPAGYIRLPREAQ